MTVGDRGDLFTEQATTKILAGQMPYYQYRDPQVIVAQMRKEIPTRPRISGTSPRGEMNNRLWNLLTKCWDYTPKSRPSCKAIQDSITRMKIRHKPSTITTETETKSAFWEAMRKGHSVEIDYARIEEILLRVSLRTFCYKSGSISKTPNSPRFPLPNRSRCHQVVMQVARRNRQFVKSSVNRQLNFT